MTRSTRTICVSPAGTVYVSDRVCSEPSAAMIEQLTGCESRSVVLGHLQRGGSPVSFDRLLAQRMGCAAVRYLTSCEDSGMVAQVAGETRLVPFSEVVGGIREVDLDGDTVATGRDLGICFGDRPVTGAVAGEARESKVALAASA